MLLLLLSDDAEKENLWFFLACSPRNQPKKRMSYGKCMYVMEKRGGGWEEEEGEGGNYDCITFFMLNLAGIIHFHLASSRKHWDSI